MRPSFSAKGLTSDQIALINVQSSDSPSGGLNTSWISYSSHGNGQANLGPLQEGGDRHTDRHCFTIGCCCDVDTQRNRVI